MGHPPSIQNPTAIQGADPENRDSNPASLGPWFPGSPKGEGDMGQPSFVIRSVLRDMEPAVPLQTLIFAIYYK